MSSIPTQSASQIQMDYMKLLVTQMQNQNPLEPMQNNEMASQLAQFSQLSQLETMNKSFAEVLQTSQMSYANSLIGKQVSFTEKDDYGDMVSRSGEVINVFRTDSGDLRLNVHTNNGPKELELNKIRSIENIYYQI